MSEKLPVVAWINSRNWFISKERHVDYQEPIVRLSDAEKIIAEKDIEIEKWKSLAGQIKSDWIPANEKLSAIIKGLKADLDEESHIRKLMSQLLSETAVSLKGPEKALHRHGWQDLPAVAAKQSERIKELEYILAPIKNASELAESAGRKALEWVDYAKKLEIDLGGAVGKENARLRSKVQKQSAALKLARDALDNTVRPDHHAWINKRDEALDAIEALGEVK